MIERVLLNSLKFFYYVALYDSVTIAAEKLFVTQGAVSKQLKNLEEALGRRLFIRDGKKLQLTGDGLTLFDCCEQVFPQIDQCLVQMTRKKKKASKMLLTKLPKIRSLLKMLRRSSQTPWKKQSMRKIKRRRKFTWKPK